MLLCSFLRYIISSSPLSDSLSLSLYPPFRVSTSTIAPSDHFVPEPIFARTRFATRQLRCDVRLCRRNRNANESSGQERVAVPLGTPIPRSHTLC